MCCCRCTDNQKQISEILDFLDSKIKKETDIIKILKHIRYSKVMVNNEFRDEYMKYLIDHSHENVIEIGDKENDSVQSEKDEIIRSINIDPKTKLGK